jgi:hypothetical protein
MKIEVTSIQSSNVSRMTYHQDSDTKYLIVTFNNGSKYKYLDVSLDTFLTTLRATSIGSAFNSLIKNNHKVVNLNGSIE